MGVGYYKELTQWSKGEYPNANQTQDDIQLIQTYGGPLRLDDHGDTAAQATPMEAVPNGSVTSLIEGGVIGGRNDVDVFSFSSGAGSISLNVLPGARGPNLDISAALFDSQGNLLALSNPVDALNAGITVAAAPAGTYYLLVDGTGKGDLTTGYSDYGSLGEYLVTGSVPSSSGSNAPPVAAASATPVSGSAPLAVSFSAGGSYDPEGGSITYDWDFGDGSAHSTSANPGHSYAAGNYTARLTVRDAGGNTDQAQVNVTASNNAPPVAVASATPTAGAAPLTVNFSSGGSYDPEGGSITYDWDFGDGSAHSSSGATGHSYAAGNYTATLTVRDASGNTDQANVNVTVQAAAATTVHVQDIAMFLTSNRAKATVTVTDAAGQPVAGAEVKGSWSGVVRRNVSGRTNSNGKVTLSSWGSSQAGTYTFTVTSVSISGYTYDPGQNLETSDSIIR
jgi:PKD repeat protein